MAPRKRLLQRESSVAGNPSGDDELGSPAPTGRHAGPIAGLTDAGTALVLGTDPRQRFSLQLILVSRRHLWAEPRGPAERGQPGSG